MLKRIEVWYDKEYFKCWLVTSYNEENDQYDVARDFYKKSDAVAYAKSLLPELVIETRKPVKMYTELGNTFSEDVVHKFANLMNLCLPPDVIKHKMGISEEMLQSIAQAYFSEQN